MSGGTPLGRRHAITLLFRTAASLTGFGAVLKPAALYALETATAALDTSAIVALHLDRMARCGTVGAERAARLGPLVLTVARRCDRQPGRRAAEAAFALMEHFGEFPPVHGPSGGSQ